MVLSVADAKKLTVPRLKEELAKRGIDSSGNKPELLARLTESIEQAAADLILAGDDADHPLLSDDILNEDILDAPSIDGEDADKLLGVSASASFVEEESKDEGDGGDEEKKEVVLEDKPVDNASVEKDKRARAIRFGLPVTAEQLGSDGAKAARAQRFGLPEDANRLASEDAKSKRAARFGITSPATDKTEQDEKKAARAARFGLPVGGSNSGSNGGSNGKDAKLAARAKRFGGAVEDDEMEAKKKARLERFGPGSK